MPAAAGSNLRNTTTFPPFSDAPQELELVNAGQHWCVLGEIQSLDFLARLVLHVRDKAGRELPIAFYSDDRGALVHGICRPGYTVAVLYGQQRNFLDGSVGIRVEELVRVKVRPPPLSAHTVFTLTRRRRSSRTRSPRCSLRTTSFSRTTQKHTGARTAARPRRSDSPAAPAANRCTTATRLVTHSRPYMCGCMGTS